ncbi:RtcB family protein [Desulfallas thermosapovorans]|uniref:tRNA-splicing ligase RtcB n=1 Tax=Desulfallas thermosapovorans DSM 6562 TaxID=1121431 RepID=A0A5S4ZTQ1_9FIRM|nr:RtcB family protein [Desulfallas thermosapovorans]TYO96233.1 tRNA-splicing ligase RtcB [Desulfallas thermosapovorans DSM 6562]
MDLFKESLNRYRLRRTGEMQVDGLVFINEHLLPLVKRDKSLEQLCAAASLPGVVGHVCGMPDIHEGFGLPIGGVMATAEGGVISAGAVGMDINCGVRLLNTNIQAKEVPIPVLRKLLQKIEEYVPTGIGKKSKHRDMDGKIFESVIYQGAGSLIERGCGWSDDLKNTEEKGFLSGASLEAVSRKACERGKEQLGTLGGGNHFIEVQIVEEVYSRVEGDLFGLLPGMLAVMIHTGSRGFGHQICTDYSRSLLGAAKRHGIDLPNRGLACAPVDSKEGRDYYAAMACAVNYAFANRQMITHDVRRAFGDVFGCPPETLGLKLVYDVAHNIAKWEKHNGKKILVHRKGATRALPPGHPQNPPSYIETGHPVLVPGSMGTASYVLTGTEKATESFYSANHGAGRKMSRKSAIKEISRDQFESSMMGVLYNSRNYKELLDEAPVAYKDIDQVVETLVAIGMVRKIARLRPLGVIKGKD